jgi:antitoxin ParD1/3/4
MPIRNVNLTKRLDQFVNKQIKKGVFQDVSEAVTAGLSLLEEQVRADREKTATFRELIQEGIDELDRGEGIEFKSEKELRDYFAKLGRPSMKKVARRRTG